MIYRIKLVSVETDGFVRELKIDSDATFLDLSKAILDSCGYPDDQMTSFYLCDDEWERGTQVTREDMGGGAADEDVYVMGDTRLSELIEDEGQHLQYVFDPFSDRCFYLDVKETIPGEDLDAPVVSRSKGKAPQQLEELDFSLPNVGKTGKGAAATAGDDFGDDLFGEGANFNDDEIDPEGFEISDGDPY